MGQIKEGRIAMGIFGNLFGEGKKPSPEPPKVLKLPFEIVTVPGEQALATFLRLRQEGMGRFTPVILGDPENCRWLDGFET
jgi:hypothetical protein